MKTLEVKCDNCGRHSSELPNVPPWWIELKFTQKLSLKKEDAIMFGLPKELDFCSMDCLAQWGWLKENLWKSAEENF